MTNPFIAYIKQFIELDATAIDAIASAIHIKNYQAGDILLQEGMVSRLSYFNLKGCVRLYYLVNGEEKTTFFYTENQFITSMRSFTQNQPADHFLACIEDCRLAVIPSETEKQLLSRFPKLETFARISLETELGNYQEMLSTFILSSPEERYLHLLQNRPDLLQRVPLYQLASYIGVKAESLSRIRNRISKRGS